MGDLIRVIRAEWTYWRYTRALPFQMFIFFLLGFAVSASDVLRVAGAATSVLKNSPVAVVQAGLVGLIYSLFAIGLFFGRGAARAFEEGYTDWEFTLPLAPQVLFWGRFLGNLALALLVVFMLPLGIETGAHMPWVDPDKVGPIRWDAHLEVLLAFLLPGVFSMGGILYGLAFWRRNHRAAIAGGVVLFFLSILTGLFLKNLELERVAFWLDPFGSSWVEHTTRYWTPSDLNTHLVPLTPAFLLSRFLWVALPIMGLIGLALRFRMRLPPVQAPKRPPEAGSTSPPLLTRVPAISPSGSRVQVFLAHLRLALHLLFSSYVFWVLVGVFGVASLVNLLFMVFLGKTYDLLMMPTTAAVLNMMGGNVFLLLVILLAVFAGELLHRDREQHTLEWIAATPHADLAFPSRALALGLALLLVLGGFVLMGIAFQTFFATPIRLATYGGWVLLLMAAPVFPYLALALFLHTLLPWKILAHLLMLAFFLFILFAGSFHVEKGIFYYGFYPGFLEPFSDITGLSPLFPQVLPWILL